MHNKYIQSIIDDNLRARYWKSGPGNEWGPGNELGAQRAEQFPHLRNYTLTLGFTQSIGLANGHQQMMSLYAVYGQSSSRK